MKQGDSANAHYAIRWDFSGKSERVLSGALVAEQGGETTRLPIDIVRLDRGVRLLFAVYDPKGGLPASRILGEATSTSSRLVLPMRNPAPEGRDFLLAVANVGSETVRLRGGADQVRPIAGDPASPQLWTEDSGRIGPGAMAILNLSRVSGLWAGVTIHFDDAKDVKITWGAPGMLLSPMGLLVTGIFVVAACVLVIVFRKRRQSGA